MYRLPLILLFLLGYNLIFSQSPHGDELKIDCAQCHTSESWLVNYNEVQFDHNTTIFKLEGAHDQTNCTECHSSLVFNEAPSQCASCHLDIHSMTVGNDCARCHTSETWLVDNIPELHEENGFPLIGAHSTLSCIDCHLSETNLRYDRLGNECVNCHKLDYINTESPNHEASGFSTNCIDCHSPLGIGWETEFIDHSFFPLTLGHDIQDCNACHLSSDFSDISPVCTSCHQNDYNESTNPNHQSLNLSMDCVVCHTTDPDWMPARFDIHDEYYPLNGAHAKISEDCAVCHNGDYNNTPNTCVGCHQEDYDNTSNPNHAQAQFSTDCMECHNEDDWVPATFDHDSQYFPIYSGEHEGEWDSCTDCHTNPNNYADYTCTSCHTNPETDDEHNGISGYVYEDKACLACHPTGIAGDGFDHNSTGFPLTGGHIDIDCTQCHTTGNYSDASPDCITCHQNDYDNTQNPNHVSAGYPTDCVSCHTTDPGWTPANINHDFFPLTLGHDIQDCNQCHTTGNYSDASPDCITCHQNDYDNTQNPNHVSTGYSTDCMSCHTTNPGWTPANINHDFFPLTLGHDIQDCNQCHTTGNYSDASPDCITCHQNDYDNTQNPNHVSTGYSTDCMSCHTTNPGWTPANINHDFFPLTLGHDIQDCNQCHTTGNYSDASPDCITCHQNDYDNTQNPNHISAGYSTDCVSCHTTNPGWTPANINHDFFPLTLGHDIQDCNQCHTTGNYSDASPDCITCHQNDYDNTQNPNHISTGYSTDCVSCHTTNPGWTPANINHDFFPLTLGHDIQDCNQCHTTGNYSDASPDCITCHQNDYDNTQNPNHVSAGFSIDCVVCHTTNPNWTPANWDHNDIYPLNGAHANIADDCAACHNGNYSNTPNTCVGCHQDDYNNTTNPNHIAVGFPDDCMLCHTESAWLPSTFDHDGQYFPIYNGAHTGSWDTCAECHTNPNNYGIFTCITCHTSSQTNNDHSEVSGYIYDSNACFQCHPDGKS